MSIDQVKRLFARFEMQTPISERRGKADLKSLEANKQSPKRDADMLKASQDFESIFITQMLNEMMKSTGGGLMGKGLGGDIYQSLFVQKLSETLSSGKGIGLSELIYEYFEKNGISTK